MSLGIGVSICAVVYHDDGLCVCLIWTPLNKEMDLRQIRRYKYICVLRESEANRM